MSKETPLIQPTSETYTVDDLHYSSTIIEFINMMTLPSESSSPQSKWVNWINVLLKELDYNFLLFNSNDAFRILDTLTDKFKAIIIMNYNQKSIKILIQVLFSLVEDEPGKISVQKVKMMKTGAAYLNNALLNRFIDDVIASDTDKN